MDYRYILVAVGIGIGATFITDLWNLFLKRSFNIESLNFCILGRWIMYMPAGTFWHPGIKTTPPKSFECVFGWLAHYTIGVVLTFLFILIVSVDWLTKPILLPALFYGISTVVFPLLVLQPMLGLGLASSKTPNPAQARIKSIMTHIMFGIGLWISAIAVKYSLGKIQLSDLLF